MLLKLTFDSWHQGDQSGEDEDPTSRVEKIFEQMDTDKDNKLTMAEFMEGSRNDPRIVQALSLQPDTSLTWTLNKWRRSGELKFLFKLFFVKWVFMFIFNAPIQIFLLS